MKEFDLNIGKILEDWEVFHAIREIIANALDEQLLTNTADIEIVKAKNIWCIRDFGRGLSYHHLTQNENPEKVDNDKVIGRFGVGLKDALATLYRHKINVKIQSKYGVITLKESTKNTFDDIITLHAQIAPPVDNQMVGTAFYVYDCPDREIDKAKKMFLQFSSDRIIETTSYGQVIAKNTDIANIYINGVKVAEESNFAFSYNITALSKQIKKALNRERSNVGRTAYADRIKSILLEATAEEILNTLSYNLESMSGGVQCDEIKWVDVAAHVVKGLNDSDDTVFVTPDELASVTGSTNEILQNSGKRIVFVSDSVKKKAEQESDVEISTIQTVVQEYNESFNYSFVEMTDLTEVELENWNMIPALLEKLGYTSWFDKCLISERLKEDADNTVGVWDHELEKIIILRSQLADQENLFGTVIHEIIHATTGAYDISRYFEYELTRMLGTLSVMYLSNEKFLSVARGNNSGPISVEITFDLDQIITTDSSIYDIDLRRVALLSMTGDLYWCADIFGLLSCYTKAIVEDCELDHCVEKYNRKCAMYMEDGVSYWMVYNYSSEYKEAFLFVTTFDDAMNLKNTIDCNIYHGAQISLLRDFMEVKDRIILKEFGSSKRATYDAYLSVNRSLLWVAKDQHKGETIEELLKAAQLKRYLSGVSDEDLECYVDEHTCPVCGCYFASYETECTHCMHDLAGDS